VYGRLFEEVGIEHRALIQETLERSMNDYPMTHGSIEEGIQHIVTLVKNKLPKSKPEPQFGDDGYVLKESPSSKPDWSAVDVMKKRRRRLRQGRFTSDD
jgi:hypothetical protein